MTIFNIEVNASTISCLEHQLGLVDKSSITAVALFSLSLLALPLRKAFNSPKESFPEEKARVSELFNAVSTSNVELEGGSEDESCVTTEEEISSVESERGAVDESFATTEEEENPSDLALQKDTSENEGTVSLSRGIYGRKNSREPYKPKEKGQGFRTFREVGQNIKKHIESLEQENKKSFYCAK